MIRFIKFYSYLVIFKICYKSVWIFVAIWAMNNISIDTLFLFYHKVLLNSYYYQNTCKVKKMIDQKNMKNIAKIYNHVFIII